MKAFTLNENETTEDLKTSVETLLSDIEANGKVKQVVHKKPRDPGRYPGIVI